MLDFFRRIIGNKDVAHRRSIRIYVSYRRADSAAYAGRLSDRLAMHFSPENIFRDVDLIPLGTDFVQTVQNEVAQCDVLLALIGPDWLSMQDSEGRRCIDSPDDFVRIELESAIQRRIPIVPVLVGDASMPTSGSMPDSISEIALRNAALIRPDPDFSRDFDRLVESIELLAARVQRDYSIEPKTQQDLPIPVPDIEDQSQTVPTVFVSHSTEDRKWVEDNIVELVRSKGLKPWYAQTSIQSATQWEREILKGLESSDWFVLVVSPRSEKSEWVKDELNWAIYHRPSRIVPVLMEPSNLWSFHIRLPRIQYVDFTSNSDTVREQFVDRLRESDVN